MRRWITALTGAMVLFIVSPLRGNAQHRHKHLSSRDSHIVSCSYTNTVRDIYLPPPEAYTSRLKSGQEAGATFVFTVENSPSYHVTATLEKAGEIWGSLIHSPVPIQVRLVFAEQETGTLAATSAPFTLYDVVNGYLPTRIYVQSLAEKFLQRNLNGNEPDMTMTYNTNVEWYFKSDGLTPETKFDFLTTVLHEMAHGLGFNGLFTVDEEMGYGSIPPGAFDGFFENSSGERLSDTSIFAQPSTELGSALTTNPVYFNSPIVINEGAEAAPGPKMYIPDLWRSGNSLYHLEELYNFAAKNYPENALMTYSAAYGEAIHDPGPITTFMLYEIGWVHTSIIHDTLKDIETLDNPISVTAEIYGDKGIEDNAQKIFYAFDGSQTYDSVAMLPTTNPDEFRADIPVPSLGTVVQYYIATQDTFGRVYTLPSEAPENFNRFFVGPDNSPPKLEHTPVQFMLVSNDSMEVKAKITDNLGLDITQVEYKINDIDQSPFDLAFDTLTEFKGYFIFTDGRVQDGDSISYRIKAVDGAVGKNTTYHPEAGYHTFKIEDVLPYVDEYSNDFEDGIEDFLVDGFYHAKPEGFSSYGLHTSHPYPSPNVANGEYEVIAQLKVPIRINPGEMFLRFDEIAYIEDGESGAVYGDEDFYDFVVVEGSTDGGNTWYEFADGYDCRYHQEWFDHFTDNQYQQNNLSTAVPDETAIRSHLVDLRAAEQFNDNDIVLIRFRLWTDPFYSGWGWGIDNIIINPTTDVREYSMVSEAIDIYPNPTTGLLNVNMQMKNEVESLEIALLDITGREIFVESYFSPGLTFRGYFDLNDLPNGVYLMKFSAGNQSLIKKVILAR